MPTRDPVKKAAQNARAYQNRKAKQGQQSGDQDDGLAMMLE